MQNNGTQEASTNGARSNDYQYKVIFAIKCFNDIHLSKSLRLTCKFQINEDYCTTSLPFSEGLFLDLAKLNPGDQILITFNNDTLKCQIGSMSILIPPSVSEKEEFEISEEFSVPLDVTQSEIKQECLQHYLSRKGGKGPLFHLEGSFYIIILNRGAFKLVEPKRNTVSTHTPEFISPKNQPIKVRKPEQRQTMHQKAKSTQKLKTLDSENQENQSVDLGKLKSKAARASHQRANYLPTTRQKTDTLHSELNLSPTGSQTQRTSSPSRIKKSTSKHSTSVAKTPRATTAVQPVKKIEETVQVATDMSYLRYFEESEQKRALLQREIGKCMNDLVKQKDSYSSLINGCHESMEQFEIDLRGLQAQVNQLENQDKRSRQTIIELRHEIEKQRNLQIEMKSLQEQTKSLRDDQTAKDRLLQQQQKRLDQQTKDIKQTFEELQSYKYESRKEKTEYMTELAGLRKQVDDQQWKLAEKDQQIDELHQRCKIAGVLESNLQLAADQIQILQNEAKDYRRQLQLLQGLVEQYKDQLLQVSQKKYEIEWSLTNDVNSTIKDLESLKEKLRQGESTQKQYEIINQELKCELRYLQGKLIVQDDLQAQLELRVEQNQRLIRDNNELTQTVQSLNTVLVSLSENQMNNIKVQAKQQPSNQKSCVYIPNQQDSLDVLLAGKLNTNEWYQRIRRENSQIDFVRKEAGQYYFGKQKVLATRENDVIYVKTGLGFQTLDDFLDLQCVLLQEEGKNTF